MDGQRGTAGMAVVAVVAVMLSGAVTACSSEKGPPAPQPTTTQAARTPVDKVAECASQIDYWITTEYLRGRPDRGDYQEMGLGSSEGLALRQLEKHLAESIKTFPAPAPANLRQQELAACDAAGAASTATGAKPPVWP